MARFWKQRIRRPKSPRRSKTNRKPQTRRLQTENLEDRKLLAGDILHNEVMPEDVTSDGFISAIDALTVINEINRGDTNPNAQDGRRGMIDVNNDGRLSPIDALMVINRLNRDADDLARRGRPGGPELPPTDSGPGGETEPTTDPADEVRAIDGSGNNLENSEFGATNTALLRIAENDYADGVSTPAGEDRPSAREISNTLSAADPEGNTSERDLTSFVFIWGQFLDHDIDLSLEPEDEQDAESFDIEVPTGDALFDPFGTGEATIPLTRSAFAEGTGTSEDNPAQQTNAITAWIDGSQVYGSDQATADALREFEGGRMLISEDGLLPTDEAGNLLAGDIRAAENLTLTSMHTLFVREHNRLAGEIASENPEFTDEEIYQEARRLVIAELQSITVNEYLPALLGEDALASYTGYNSSVDPSIANEFSTAAFRFGHSTLNDEFRFVGNDGVEIDDPIALASAFFNPALLEETGIDSLLKYGSSTLSQEIDLQVVDGLRNFLFGAPGSGGLDLVSLNIQRGRDHGLADFNTTRVAYGLDAYESFAEITSDVDLQNNLESLYGDVDNIDLWVGLLAEDHAEGSSLGETATLIIADQFERLRDGDRFWYENVFQGRELREIENTTLSDIIQRNTDIDTMQANVFFFSPEIAGTVLAETSSSVDNVQASGRPSNNGPTRNGRRGDANRPDESGPTTVAAVGIEVELVDSDGNVVETALTDQNGDYAFGSMGQSGAYEVRIATSNAVQTVGDDSWHITISNGEELLKQLDFRVII